MNDFYKPVFASHYRPTFSKTGTITAASSSGLSDGAAAMVLMRESRAEELGIMPLFRILGYADAAREPVEFAIGYNLFSFLCSFLHSYLSFTLLYFLFNFSRFYLLSQLQQTRSLAHSRRRARPWRTWISTRSTRRSVRWR